MANVVPPCIPHIGVFLTDLTFIDDGNEDIVDNRFINFAKFRLVYRTIRGIGQYQDTQYNLTPVESIQQYLEHDIEVSNEDESTMKELFEISLSIEPRNWDGTSPIGSD